MDLSKQRFASGGFDILSFLGRDDVTILFGKLLAAALAVSVFAQASYAQDSEPVEDVEAVAPALEMSATPSLTESDLSAWLDGFMPYALMTGDIVGAVVTVVKDDQVLTNRGYGYADLETDAPVDASETLFRPGSISKLFIWTAVMQLVEQGKISLDTDVNVYLDFNLPTNRGIVTMRHLMTHTPGFQEVAKDLFVENQTFEDADLREYLVTHIPQQIFDPGRIPSYSNYASSLAGYIVERVSGEPFATYIENHIFAPLGMVRSSFRQPLPDALAASMSKGYKSASDGISQSFEVVVPMPAGALSSTGDDMAKFMIAHLSGGAGLMQPETAEQMHTTLDNQFPPINGAALGFYREDLGGLNIIAHGGDTAWFHSNMVLLLDHGVGLYVSVNSGGGQAAGPLRRTLFTEFVDRYYPYETETPAPLSTSMAHSALAAGVYESSRAAEGNVLAIVRYASQLKVTVTEDGALKTPLIPGLSGSGEPLFEVAPWLWQSKSGRRVAARIEGGVVTALATDPALFTFTPVPWYRSSAWLNPVMIGAAAVIILTFIAWPVRATARWRLNVSFPYRGARKKAYRLAPTAALLVILYFAGWGIFLTWLSGSIFNLEASRNESLLMLLYVSSILPIIAAFLSVSSARVVLGSRSTLFQKVSSIALVASMVFVIWFSVVVGFFSFDTGF